MLEGIREGGPPGLNTTCLGKNMADISDEINEVLSVVKAPIEHEAFFSRIYLYLSKKQKINFKKKDVITKLVREEYHDLSYLLDKTTIQDSCAYRNNSRTRKLATLLVNEKGKLDQARLEQTIESLEKNLFSLGPERQHDVSRQRHILKILKRLASNKDDALLLQRINRPLSHQGAESIIRDTLGLSDKVALKDYHARRAALAAWMSYLRQNVGSCFATAPAIIIHGEQGDRFLKDVAEMLATGRLKRTYGGVEYSVPLSSSWGVADLKKPFVLTIETQVGKSIGFVGAFQKAGILKQKLTKKQLYKATRQMIMSAYNLLGNRGVSLVTTPEEVIRKVLLLHNQITEDDVKEYNNSSGASHFASLLGYSTKNKGADKGQACKNFHQQIEVAYSYFKSLTDNALLKSWEFTIASFAETKAVFARWNLYSSLGLAPNDRDGIGNCLFEILKEKLEKSNDLVHEMDEQYERYFLQVQNLEARMGRAATEEELKSLKREYQTLVREMNYYLEQRNAAHSAAHRWANLFDFIIDQYDGKFREYFQEVYDADLLEVATDPYDDTPAGFRLVFKHGRSNTSSWTQIRDHNQFIDFLAEFFSVTEREISSLAEMEGIERDFGEIVTAIVSHIRTRAFLESALYRMAEAHGGRMVENPIENLDQVDKKPWVYTSGGTMNHLVSSYYCREELPATEGRFVDNETELFAFLLDTMKSLHTNDTQGFVENPEKSMLIHSPTHAFVFKPGTSPFVEGWLDKGYSYTWIRDQIVIPQQHFIKNIDLDQYMMQDLIEEIGNKLIEPYRHIFKRALSHFSGIKSVNAFRSEIIMTMNMETGLHVRGEYVLELHEIDSVLYSMLPMQLGHEIGPCIQRIVERMTGLSEEVKQEMMMVFGELSHTLNRFKVISAKRLQEIVKALLLLVIQSPSTSEDFHGQICRAAQDLGLAMPRPVIFADTNWSRDFFAFVVNPGTSELEFWRVDAIGSEGIGMVRWKKWLDGSVQKPAWGVYTRPFEYGG
ncbi:MAG: hypothetical protein ACI9S8_000074 [Chlamydiales bacterium]